MELAPAGVGGEVPGLWLVPDVARVHTEPGTQVQVACVGGAGVPAVRAAQPLQQPLGSYFYTSQHAYMHF